MGKAPPETKRYCLNCEKVTKFRYDHFIGHSYCSKCGRSSQFAKRPKPKEITQ